jgi:CRISPR-associated protein Cas1
MEIRQNTLYLTTQNSYVSRDHLTLRIEVERELKLVVPIHHLESICVFGQSLISPSALELCWERGVPVNYFSEHGYFLGRWEGVANTSVMLRRAQYRAADDPHKAASIARQIVAGKLQNSRQSLLRSARETDLPEEEKALRTATDEVLRILKRLREFQPVFVRIPRSSEGLDAINSQPSISTQSRSDGPKAYDDHLGDSQVEKLFYLDRVRGFEGQGANIYFKVFSLHLRQQRVDFPFTRRLRRPALDAMNCLLSFLYALVRHDCIAALCATGLDPFVGYLHADRPNRPGLALDLMEEFRPLIADRLAITLVNRRQIEPKDFGVREGGAFELKKYSRKAIIAAYQTRKQDMIKHPILNQKVRIGHLMLVQARILARHLRGDIPDYLPCLVR